MISDIIFAKSGGEFPYRKYIYGTSGNLIKLKTLLENYTPKYDIDGFEESKLKDKVKSKLQGKDNIFSLFAKGPKNVAQENDWELNMIIDQYTENARMSSPGYGVKYTPLDIWYNKEYEKLRSTMFSKSRILIDVREEIYRKGEVRPAYVTDSIGLYKHLVSNYTNVKSPKVLDITAFGDRLTAAAALGLDYTGVDPDPNLVEGLSILKQDLKTINPDFRCETYSVPLEHFSTLDSFDIVTFSPPPYDAEPYTGGDRQVHKVYKDVNHWIFGFLNEILTRAFTQLKEKGILAFTVLDRPTITYTEAMIFLAMKIGFRPLEIFTLSSNSGTPWWVFIKDSEYYSEHLDIYYPELILDKVMFNNEPSIEYIRYISSRYIMKLCENHNIFTRSEKTKDILGRILMSKLNTSQSVDPLFPTSESEYIIEESEFNDIQNVILPIVIQTQDSGFRICITGNSTQDILNQILNSVIRYIHWIQCTVEYDNFKKCVKIGKNNLFVERNHHISSIAFLRKRALFTEECLENIRVFPKYIQIWHTKDVKCTKESISSYIRYDAVGLYSHHLTRTDSRIEAIAKIAGLKSYNEIVDLFATPSNANSKLYTSPFPDVDPKSLGNFFTYDGGDHRVLMANPPPYEKFKELMIVKLLEDYVRNGKIIFYSTSLWKDNSEKYIERIINNEDPDFTDVSSQYFDLKYLWNNYKHLIRGVYILDYNKHPTYDSSNDKVYERKLRENTESLGIVISENEVDLSDIDLLSGGKHYIYE